MPAALQITGFGFQELNQKLSTMGEDIQNEADVLIQDGAQRIAAMAKTLAPVDFGFLKNLIYAEGGSVFSDAGYAAYLEFGTGAKVDVPPEWEDYAIQFKGEKEVSGIFPHPYFFPALDAVAPSIIADVEAMLQEVADK
jgi:hypothetical protein